MTRGIGSHLYNSPMVLREACLDLFQRTANDRQESMDEAMVRHVGKHSKVVIPGTERIYRGQGAERALAA